MSHSLTDRLQAFLRARSLPHVSGADASSYSWIPQLSVEDVQSVMDMVCDSKVEAWERDPAGTATLLVALIGRLHQGPVELSSQAVAGVRRIYPALVDRPAIQSLLLRLLVATRGAEALAAFSQLIVANPPLTSRLQLEVFADLFKLDAGQLAALFPALLEGLDHPALASYVLDYANYTFRQQLVPTHPAAHRARDLRSLLSQLAERLGKLQDSAPTSQDEAAAIGKQVTESVALAVALCDALAGIGDPQAIAALNKTLHVEHRRLRVEAAAALARLGVEDARKLLIAMAAEPAERLRVLAYTAELGCLDEVDEQYSSPAARAEAEMVAFLSQPTQIGMAPRHIELIDQRELAWPGFEEPRNCFLFQYVYAFPQGEFSNIGIAGPLVMAVNSDLKQLSTDDIYALFAGWHVDHPAIHASKPERARGQQLVDLDRLMTSLTDAEELEDVVPTLVGAMFERPVLIAAARRRGESGWVVVSDDAVNWMSMGNPNAPLGAGEAFYMFVGRKLLASFN